MQWTESMIDDRLVAMGYGERLRPPYTQISVLRGVRLSERRDGYRIQLHIEDPIPNLRHIAEHAIARLTAAFQDADNVRVDQELGGCARVAA